MKLPETRLGRTLAILAGAVAVTTAAGGCVKTWREAAAARQIAQDEPKALKAYEALASQVKDLQVETRKLRESQIEFASYFKGYLVLARGATELPNEDLAIPEAPVDKEWKPDAPPKEGAPKPTASKPGSPFDHFPSLFIIPPVPQPKPKANQSVHAEPPSPATLGWEE